MSTSQIALPGARVRRGFVDVDEGQVHYREAGRAHGGRPLVALHPSPGSAKMLEPLISALGVDRWVIGLDTLGNGDSSAPAWAQSVPPPPTGWHDFDAVPDDLTIDEERELAVRLARVPPLTYFSEAHLRALDGLAIGEFDLYGSHTGANLACEIAIAAPDRVRRVIIDGISLYSPGRRLDMLRHYAPGVSFDQSGSQLNWIFQFVRDAYLFWPWYRRDAAHCRGIGLPGAEVLHDKAVEVLKAARTYWITYQSAIGYDKSSRLPLITAPALLSCARDDMMLEFLERAQALLPTAEVAITAGMGTSEALASTTAVFRRFLQG